MYLRTTQQRRKDGRVVRYLQLAESYRNASGQTVARVVSHLGREDEVDRAGLERLVASIGRFLGGDAPAVRGGDGVGGEGFALEGAWELGGPHVVAALWEELGIAKTLRRAARRGRFTTDVERAVLLLVCQRMLEPGSKLAATRWLADEIRLPGIVEVSDDQLYRAMDFLLAEADAVQEAVFFSVANLLNLEVDLIFFDTTSTYFEVEPDHDPDADEDPDADTAEAAGEAPLRRLGHSKDHRPDLPQVVIGLAVTKSGIPVRCWVWPGNTSDQTVVEQVRDDLRGWKLGRSVLVCDSGFSGRDNLAYLTRAGGHYLAGIKLRAGMADVEAVLSRQGRYLPVADNLSVKEVWVNRGGAGERRFIVCKNTDEARRDKTRREQAIARIEAELVALKTLRTDAHHKRECALRAHPSLGRWLRQTPSGRLVVDRQRIAAEERLDGKYLIETSDRTLSAADAALAYKNLLQAERGFRHLKGRIELRPVYHRLDERIRSHVLVCFLALLLVRLAETRTGQSWPAQRRLLRRIKLARFSSKDGRFDQRSELDAEQKALLSALHVAEPARVGTVSV